MTKPSIDDRTVDVSSPACSMHEASDAYMGYVDRDELIVSLDELLEWPSGPARGSRSKAPAQPPPAR